MNVASWMVLVGPAAAGKSTLGAGLAVASGRTFVDVDALGEVYYGEVGWSMERLRDRIRAVGRVVLVLPSPDPERSVEILRQRSLAAKGTDWISADGHDFLREWVRDPGVRVLATMVFHTEGEGPEQSVGRLLTMCR